MMRSWCGMWAKRNGCGCFLGLSSFLGALVLLLELVLAILTLTVRTKVLQMLCEKVEKLELRSLEDRQKGEERLLISSYFA